MEFGAFLPTYWQDYGSSSVAVAIETAAKAAEALGYASVWANDHVVGPPGQAGAGHCIEPLITLASLVHLVPRLQLGTSVLVLPQRHAVVVAKQVAALDALSNSRFIFGIGIGWLEDEFRYLNADFERRAAVADEAIAAMRVLWRDSPATFRGEFYQFEDATFFPKPLDDGPPIWVGGNTRPALRRAARYGDAWVPYGINLHDFRTGVETLRAYCAGCRLPTIAAHLRLRIGDDRGNRSIDIAGSPEQIVETLQQYRRAGLQYLICEFPTDDVDDLVRQMDWMATAVMPELNQDEPFESRPIA